VEERNKSQASQSVGEHVFVKVARGTLAAILAAREKERERRLFSTCRQWRPVLVEVEVLFKTGQELDARQK
jgi:hypothetical protein